MSIQKIITIVIIAAVAVAIIAIFIFTISNSTNSNATKQELLINEIEKSARNDVDKFKEIMGEEEIYVGTFRSIMYIKERTINTIIIPYKVEDKIYLLVLNAATSPPEIILHVPF